MSIQGRFTRSQIGYDHACNRGKFGGGHTCGKSLDIGSNFFATMLCQCTVDQQIDKAAAIIRSYLAHPECSLQTLCLRSADVDDDECCDLMNAMSHNKSLTKLDVSGERELSNILYMLHVNSCGRNAFTQTDVLFVTKTRLVLVAHESRH